MKPLEQAMNRAQLIVIIMLATFVGFAIGCLLGSAAVISAIR